MRPVYCTREQVKAALDSVETARNNRKIDRHIAAGAQSVEKLTLRKFYPQVATRTLDWYPELDTPRSWRLWLGENEMATQPTAITAGGETIALADVYARPDTGPPFDHLEINRGSSAAWISAATSQRAISVASTFASCAIDDVAAATLAAGINSTVTTASISASWEIGVGSLLLCGTERMWVTGRSMLTTGQTLLTPMDNQQSSTAVAVTTGSAFTEDEVIMLDSEKMRVDEITGNTLRVTRKWDGTALAAHTGSTVYSPRSLTVERGVLGTTAASHSLGDSVLVYRPPALINQLNAAYAVVGFLDEASGYSRTVGSGENEREAAGRRLMQLEDRVKRGFYRVRTGTAS
ncbi:MAG TPA: hypothetical protein VJ625_17165 [Propionibacteriaceae bacterium]|nr:hypothetical protein [Propionibacteriaceae bacterium]